MIFLRSIIANLKTHYDKLIAFVILAVLVASLIYLAVQLGLIQGSDKAFRGKMSAFTPKFPNTEKVDTASFDVARKVIFEPYVIDGEVWSNTPLFVVEQRFWCDSCEKPVAWEAKSCPFCGYEVPEDPEVHPGGDIDGDGLTYAIEVANQMDPDDASDAGMDFDNDGFTNYEELTAEIPTNPRDETDRPPDVQKLKVDALGVNPFRLRFKSHIKTLDGSLRFGLNLQKKGKPPKTYFKKIDGDVEGFTLVKYEEKIIEDVDTGKKDISELTLKRGKKVIVLVKGQDVQHDEYLVRFYFEPQDLKIVRAVGSTFDLKEITYKVISVDISAQSVVIMRLSNSKELTIRKVPALSGSN